MNGQLKPEYQEMILDYMRKNGWGSGVHTRILGTTGDTDFVVYLAKEGVGTSERKLNEIISEMEK